MSKNETVETVETNNEREEGVKPLFTLNHEGTDAKTVFGDKYISDPTKMDVLSDNGFSRVLFDGFRSGVVGDAAYTLASVILSEIYGLRLDKPSESAELLTRAITSKDGRMKFLSTLAVVSLISDGKDPKEALKEIKGALGM